MSFHPDQHLPGCMMPDGGECCAGYSALCVAWHMQRVRIEALEEQYAESRQELMKWIRNDGADKRIEALEAALRKIAGLVDGEAGEPLADAIEIARAALKEQGK